MSRALVLAVVAACGGSSTAVDVDAASDDAPDLDAAACTLPAPAPTCDPAAKPLPNPSCLAEEPGTGGCPPGMVRIATFCIDRYEATIDGVSPYWNPGATPPPAHSRANAVP